MRSIQYQTDSKESIAGYFYMLRNSAAFRLKILINGVIVTLPPALVIYFLTGQLSSTNIYLLVFIFVFFPIALPVISMLLAKSGSKKIEISENGLNITVGNRGQLVPWSRIKQISQNSAFLYILAKSGNLLCIPKTAFTSPQAYTEFMENIEACKNA